MTVRVRTVVQQAFCLTTVTVFVFTPQQQVLRTVRHLQGLQLQTFSQGHGRQQGSAATACEPTKTIAKIAKHANKFFIILFFLRKELKNQWAWQDSNLRRSACNTDILAAELHTHNLFS